MSQEIAKEIGALAEEPLAPSGDNENSAALDFELEKDIGFGSDKASTADIDFEAGSKGATASAADNDSDLKPPA